MMILDHKKALATIMAKRDPKDGSMSSAPMKPEITKNEDGSLDGRHAASQDMLLAIKEGSAEKFKEALSNFYDLHMAMSNEELNESPDVE